MSTSIKTSLAIRADAGNLPTIGSYKIVRHSCNLWKERIVYRALLPSPYFYRMLLVAMKIKQILKQLTLGIVLVLGLTTVLLVVSVQAAGNNGCETDTAIISCGNVSVDQPGIENTGIWSILLTAINILTAAIGVAAVGGIVYGAILYTSAGGSQEQTKKAIGVITNVAIGVIAYALMYVGLNFLIPGGIFR